MEKEPIPKFELKKEEFEEKIPKEAIVEAPKEEVKELEEGSEKWAKEIPAETFGTEEERKMNYLRLCLELEYERERRGISPEEFQERLEKAREFLENMPLFHGTSLKSAVKIFETGKILSTDELGKKLGKEARFTTDTVKNDEKVGLNKFVFSSTEPLRYGEVALAIDRKILDRPDCVVTAEDICWISDRFKRLGCWPWQYEIDPEPLKKIQEEYKKQVISGEEFKDFLSHFIATHHENPDEYMGYYRSEEYDIQKNEHFYSHREDEIISCFPGEWYRPEIKVSNEIKCEDIPFILVESQENADLLIREGIPKEKIRIGSFLDPAVRKELISQS